MIALLLISLASFAAAPLAPLNPIEQDTLPGQTLHFSAGFTSPNGIVSAGAEVSAKYEMMVLHPWVIRGGLDLKYAQTVSNLYPRGDLLSTTASLDALYYRGTDHLMGYIGLGAVYTMNHFSSSPATADSLFLFESVTDVDISRQWGYRVTLGMRFHSRYSLEIAVTELRPDFIKHGIRPGGTISRAFQNTRTGSFRITLGYVIPLSRR